MLIVSYCIFYKFSAIHTQKASTSSQSSSTNIGKVKRGALQKNIVTSDEELQDSPEPLQKTISGLLNYIIDSSVAFSNYSKSDSFSQTSGKISGMCKTCQPCRSRLSIQDQAEIPVICKTCHPCTRGLSIQDRVQKEWIISDKEVLESPEALEKIDKAIVETFNDTFDNSIVTSNYFKLDSFSQPSDKIPGMCKKCHPCRSRLSLDQAEIPVMCKTCHPCGRGLSRLDQVEIASWKNDPYSWEY